MKMKEIMPKADKPVSLQKLDTWVAAYPPFSFDLIIDDLIQALNRLWSGPFFSPGYSWVDIDDDKIPHCSDKWSLHRWRTQPTTDKQSVSTGWIIWLCPQKMMFKLRDMMRNVVNNVLPLGQVDMRAQLVFF